MWVKNPWPSGCFLRHLLAFRDGKRATRAWGVSLDTNKGRSSVRERQWRPSTTQMRLPRPVYEVPRRRLINKVIALAAQGSQVKVGGLAPIEQRLRVSCAAGARQRPEDHAGDGLGPVLRRHGAGGVEVHHHETAIGVRVFRVAHVMWRVPGAYRLGVGRREATERCDCCQHRRRRGANSPPQPDGLPCHARTC